MYSKGVGNRIIFLNTSYVESHWLDFEQTRRTGYGKVRSKRERVQVAKKQAWALEISPYDHEINRTRSAEWLQQTRSDRNSAWQRFFEVRTKRKKCHTALRKWERSQETLIRGLEIMQVKIEVGISSFVVLRKLGIWRWLYNVSAFERLRDNY